MQIAHTLTDHSLTVLGPNFAPKTIPSSHPQWDEIVTALKANDNETLNRLIDLPTQIGEFTQGLVKVVDRQVFFNGRVVNSGLATRIASFIRDGQTHMAQPLVHFLEKVMENPSYRAVNGLFEWVERSGLPIAPDGDIFAWKIVGPDYMSLYSGGGAEKFDNTPGNVVEVDRNQVDEDPDRTCSYGLHFCSTTYLPKYGKGAGNRVVIVKLHPRDVVAFPRDYNTSKGRACRYEVIGEIDREQAAEFFPNERVYDIGEESDEGEPFGIDLSDAEVGDKFMTRDGRKVEIVQIDDLDDDDETYPFIGRDENGDENTYSLTGLIYDDREGDDDLVARVDTTPSPQPVPAAARRRGLLSWFLYR